MVFLPEAGHDPGAQAGARAPAQGVTDLEPLEEVTTLRLLPDHVQDLESLEECSHHHF